MQLTKEKLSYLLFLYKQREMDYTVTRLAQEVGVSKSTFSRVLNTFYQEGLTTEKGKGILSCQGCRMAREYLKDISGDMLSANLDDGQYLFAFTVYKADKMEISMANDGFFHPGILDIKMGHGGLVLKPKEVERESMMGKMVLKGKLSSLKYQVGEDYLECRMIKDDYIIPISKLRFHYSKEERILQTSVKIKVKPTVGKIHMPESIAIMNVIIK